MGGAVGGAALDFAAGAGGGDGAGVDLVRDVAGGEEQKREQGERMGAHVGFLWWVLCGC